MDDYMDFLRRVYFFKDLSEKEIYQIHAVCHEEKYEQDQIVFLEGTPGDKFYIILDGVVEIWKDYKDSDRNLLTIYSKGQMFGEIALIDDLPRSATVVSIEPTRLLSINRDDFNAVFLQNTAVSRSIMKSVSAMIRRSNDNFINELQTKDRYLKKTYKQLKLEIEERKKAEEDLKKHRDHLEKLVKARTSELEKTADKLKQKINEHKQAEEAKERAESALEETSVLFATIFDAIPDIISVQNSEHSVIQYNMAGYSFLAMKHEEIAGKKCFELLGMDKPCATCAVAISLRSKQPARIEKYDADRKRWFDARAYPIIDSEGKVTKVVEHLRDITDEKKVAEELLATNQKYRLLVDNSSDAIFIVQDGEIKFPNKKALDLAKNLGFELDQVPYVNYIHPEDRNIVMERHIKRINGEELPPTYSFRLMSESGQKLWIELTSARITWEGKPATLNFLKDITAQKQLEAQIQQIQRMESIGTLAGGIAHNFNNLLMGICGGVSIMLLDEDLPDRHVEELKCIQGCIDTGANLTKQLLVFASGGKLIAEPTNINKIIKTTSSMFGHTKKEIKIHRTYQKKIWAVDADQGQIEIVLLNLFVNAGQAMPDGGDLYISTENIILDEAFVEPFGARPGRYVKIMVKDTGIGMDEATSQKIFEPFFTTKEIGTGTGLGLSSALGIIKNHDGIINFMSKKNEGTIFTIYLPASEKALATNIVTVEELPRGSGTILLVDDEDIIIKIVTSMLEELGYDVLAVRGGEEAVEVYKDNMDQIDLVILDMIMPEMGGKETYEKLKAINSNVKVLLSSGYHVGGMVTDILNRGCDGFIQKPFKPKALSQKIGALLGHVNQ